MDKKILVNFSLIFVVGLVSIIALALIGKKTGLSEYKDITTRYWEDEKQYAMFVKTSPNLYAYWNRNDQVRASVGSDITDWAINQAVRSITRNFYFTDGDAHVSGWLDNFIGGGLDESGQFAFGCRYTDLQDATLGEENENCNLEDVYYNNPEIYVDPAGTSTIPINNTLGNNTGKKNSGLIGASNKVATELYIRSNSTININLYAQKSIEEIPIMGQRVNAAPLFWGEVQKASLGEGFFNVWKAARNISYYLIIIPTVAFGFAIMFRMQINPQTQITLTRAIPRILVVILLITFSYPLSALIIQMVGPIHDAVLVLVNQFADAALPDFQASTVFASWANLIIHSSFSFTSTLGRGLFSLLVMAVMGLMAVIVFLRYVMAVFITAIKIGFLVAFSPLILLVAAFPGKEDVIKQYFINLSALAFGFGAISIMFATSWMFLQVAMQTEGAIGFLGFSFVAMGILWKSPSAPKLIGDSIGAKPLMGGGGDPRKR